MAGPTNLREALRAAGLGAAQPPERPTGICPVGKVAYPSKVAARAVMLRHRRASGSTNYRVYSCGICTGWHITTRGR
jgi:hypothetical protein